MAIEIIFTQLDTWFFKEPRPMESIGGSQLGSVFPPSSATLSGAIRSAIGELLDIDWKLYHQNETQKLKLEVDPYEVIGDGERTGSVTFDYPSIVVQKNNKWTTLVPAPTDLMKRNSGDIVTLEIPKAPVRCDIGTVRLPALPSSESADDKVAKPLEGCWLTQHGWNEYRNGRAVTQEHVVSIDELVSREPRIGIARNNSLGTSIDGMLYQTEHLRVSNQKFADVGLKMRVHGLPVSVEKLLINELSAVRLGGEARMALVEVNEASAAKLEAVKPKRTNKLVFKAPAYFESKSGWLPTDAKKINNDSHDVFQFEINGKSVSLVCQISDKPIQIGGWDYKLKQPKPLRSFLPAGSCWYVHSDEPLTNTDVQKIGKLTQFGYGNAELIAWNDE